MAELSLFQTSSFYTSLFSDLGLEILFLTIVLATSILIFKTTKESYEITKYKGIKYFRNAFLFLGIAYLSRFLFYLFSYIHYYQLIDYLNLAPRMFGGGSMFIYTLTSSIALLSLLYAISFNKIKGKEIHSSLIYIVGLVISFVSLFKFEILLVTHSLIALTIIFSVLFQKKKSKKSSLGVAYIWLAIFWILSIFGDLFYLSVFDFFRSVLYSILVLILLFITFRIIKKIR